MGCECRYVREGDGGQGVARGGIGRGEAKTCMEMGGAGYMGEGREGETGGEGLGKGENIDSKDKQEIYESSQEDEEKMGIVSHCYHLTSLLTHHGEHLVGQVATSLT